MAERGASPDSSTQPKEKHKKSRKRKSKHHTLTHSHKNKKKSKKEKHSNGEPPVAAACSGSKNNKQRDGRTKGKQHHSSTASRLTSQSTIKPLGEYVEDREELHKQLFTVMSKKELKEMLPDILKKEDLKEIKGLCFEQLKAVPMEKLKRIISGEEVQSSSDESEELKEDGENQLEAVAMETEPAEEQVAINQQLDCSSEEEEEKDADIFEELITAPNQEDIDELVEGSPAHSSHEGVKDHNQATTQAPPLFGELSGAPGKVPIFNEELELKELEYRARALKSLVQAREKQMKAAGKNSSESIS